MPQQLQRRLYRSQLTSREHLKGIANIAQVGRAFTAAHRVSGLLVFDGLRFCEYLEGPPLAMAQLMARIETDPRHERLVHLIHAPLPGARLFTSWGLAYVLDEETEPLSQMEGLEGEAALAYFMSLVPALDMV